jgi:hypothetical protein
VITRRYFVDHVVVLQRTIENITKQAIETITIYSFQIPEETMNYSFYTCLSSFSIVLTKYMKLGNIKRKKSLEALSFGGLGTLH